MPGERRRLAPLRKTAPSGGLALALRAGFGVGVVGLGGRPPPRHGLLLVGLGLSGPVTLRMTGDQPFVTDGGHFILDASFGRIPDTRALSNALFAIPGVVEHGLFIGLASTAIIAGGDGIETVHAA